MTKNILTNEEVSNLITQHISQLVDNVISTSKTYVIEGEEINYAKKRLVEEPAKYFSQLYYIKDSLIDKEMLIESYRAREDREDDAGRYDRQVEKIQDQIKPMEAEIAYYQLKYDIACIGYEVVMGKGYDRTAELEIKAKWKANRKA